MADIRKRNGSKGITYQVRYPSKAAATGYAYRTFDTLKEAREFRESGETKIISTRSGSGHILTVADGLHKWLEVCEKEGRDGRDPVTAFTLKGQSSTQHFARPTLFSHQFATYLIVIVFC